jgi:DNA-binding MarR family transcriptional regulator
MGDIYDLTTYHPKKSVGYLLSRVRVEMLATLDRELAGDRRVGPLEISSAQFIVIAMLAVASGPMSASDLCKGISYDAGAMTRMLDRLETKGLIRRNRSAQDRRLTYLELTDEGLAVYPRMREISMQVANHFLRGFSKTEARQLEGLLGRMFENSQAEAHLVSA